MGYYHYFIGWAGGEMAGVVESGIFKKEAPINGREELSVGKLVVQVRVRSFADALLPLRCRGRREMRLAHLVAVARLVRIELHLG